MKTLYLLLSNLAALVFGYLFVINLKYSFEFSYLIYMSLLFLLFFIFIILSVLSYSKRSKSKSLFYNSYSDRRTKNQEFDKYYSFMNK
jgi:hypothetical protein